MKEKKLKFFLIYLILIYLLNFFNQKFFSLLKLNFFLKIKNIFQIVIIEFFLENF